MEQITFAIHISTKNRKEDLLQTLENIKPLLIRSDVECVVFDDGSNDGSSTAVQNKFPEVTLIRNEHSKGYIYCRNKMLNETTAKYAVSLDDDAHFLSQKPLEEIEKYFNQNQECGLIAFRIFWGNEAPATTETKQTPQRVKSYVGCGHVWRIDAWKTIRPYPEWFEFYGEENFASIELLANAWEVHYVPQIMIWHRVDMKARKVMKGATSRYRRALRNDWHLYFLFYPWPKIPKRMAYSLWMQSKKVFAGNFKVVKPLLRALFETASSFGSYHTNRKALTNEQFVAYNQLPDAKIYWQPEQD